MHDRAGGIRIEIAVVRRLDAPATGFDRDGYSVPARPLISEPVEVIALQRPAPRLRR